MAAPPPSAPGEPAPPPPPLQYSLLLQHLVGDKRQPRVWDPAALGGIPCPPKSEEQKMVERVMESCPFKAALACVGGAAAGRTGQAALGWFGGPTDGKMEKRLQPPVFIFLLSLLQCLSHVPERDLCLPCGGTGAHGLSLAQHRLSQCPQYREIRVPVTVQRSQTAAAEPLHCLQGMCRSSAAEFISFWLSFTGFVLGGAFGIFTAGIDTNVGFDPKDPYRTPTAKEVLKDMGQRGISYAKNFAIVGAMFSFTECVVESVSKNLSTIKKCFLVLFKVFY